jgi:hypothetical protein
MPEVLQSLGAGTLKQCDYWVSQAHFTKPNRRKQNLSSVGLLFVDLDYRQIPTFKYASPERMLEKVLGECRQRHIPEPTIAIASSGGGLQLKWLCQQLPAAALPRWQAVQRWLVILFAKLGADRQAKDVSRVLRLLSTKHQASGQIVRLLHLSGGWSNPTRYRFDYLCRTILPLAREEVERRRAETRSAYQTASGPNRTQPEWLARAGQGRVTLNWVRFLDCMLLAELRGWTQEPGTENDVIFLAYLAVNYLAAAKVNDPGLDFWRESREIARRLHLKPDWADEETPGISGTGGLNRLQKVRYGRPLYTPTTAWLIERFDISSEERSRLSTMITRDEAKERDRKRQEARRRAAGSITRAEYEAQGRARVEQATKLRNSGNSISEIAKQMNTRIAAVDHLLRR